MMLDALRLAFITTLLLGGASLERLDDAFGELGVFGEVRFAGMLLVATALTLFMAAPRRPPLSGPLFAWLLLLAALHAEVAASWLWSDRTPYAKAQLLEVGFSAAALALAVPLVRDAPERCLRLFLVVLYGSAVAFVLVSLVLSGAPAGELAGAGAGGIGGARLLCMGVLAAAWLMREGGRHAWLLLVPVPLMLAGAVVSGSRAAVLALLIALGVSWLHWRSDRDGSTTAGSHSRRGMSALLAVGLLAAVTVPFTRAIGQIWLEQLLASSSAAGGIYLADRDVIFADAWQQFSIHPLGGIGIGSYIGPFGEQYPHNLLLSFAIDAGAFALAGAFLGITAGFAVLVGQRSTAAGAALAGASFFAVVSFFAGSYYDARFLWVFLLFGFGLRAPLGGRIGVLHLARAPDAEEVPA